jgi:hypothetical protein
VVHALDPHAVGRRARDNLLDLRPPLAGQPSLRIVFSAGRGSMPQ